MESSGEMTTRVSMIASCNFVHVSFGPLINFNFKFKFSKFKIQNSNSNSNSNLRHDVVVDLSDEEIVDAGCTKVPGLNHKACL